MLFGFKKFQCYLIGSLVIVYTDHSAHEHLLSKKDAKTYEVDFAFVRMRLLD